MMPPIRIIFPELWHQTEANMKKKRNKQPCYLEKSFSSTSLFGFKQSYDTIYIFYDVIPFRTKKIRNSRFKSRI